MDGLPLGMDRNNKALVDQAVSVLSVPYRGVSVKFKDVKNILKTLYVPTDNIDIGGMIEGNCNPANFAGSLSGKKNNSGTNQAVSVLSVPYRGVSVKFKDVKNILKTPCIPTDNTDSTMLIGVILKSIDFHYFLNREDKKWGKPGTVSVVSSLYGVCVGINRIKNILKTPYTPTDNTDSTIFIFIWKNTYLVDSTFFFNINTKIGKGGSGNE
jgi:hypothetical protein